VAIVSHELRTPLTSVRGFLTLLQMGAFGELTDKTVHAASRAEANVVRLINLINDLLDLEKVESGTIKLDRSLFAVAALINQTVDTMQENADEHKVHLKVECPPESHIFADSNRLLQVLVNLTSNAIKYSPSGGEVCISWRQMTSDGGEISITDEGPGIPEAQRAAVFERFYQVGGANQKHGSGLGLAICKAIIEQHGGMIGVDNIGQKGSRFWFRIPGTSAGVEKLGLEADPSLSKI
jgi:signal transduction histidine kinase